MAKRRLEYIGGYQPERLGPDDDGLPKGPPPQGGTGAVQAGAGYRPWRPIETARPGELLLFCSMDPAIELRAAYFVDYLDRERRLVLFPDRSASHWTYLPNAPRGDRS